jgi:transcriptional regulator with XRE-family HTH domain
MLERLHMIGRTQESVARALGCSEKHLSMIFTNQADPSFVFARRMWAEIMEES